MRSVALNGPEGEGRPVAQVFQRLGWQVREHDVFADLHLRALYLSQPDLPRIFISELGPTSLPPETQRALATLTTPPAPADVNDSGALASWFSAPPPPKRHAVDVVASVSSYGAWPLCFDRRVNHFTAAVDDVASWRGVPMKAEIDGPVPGPGGVGLRYAYFGIAECRGGFDGFLASQARHLFDQTS